MWTEARRDQVADSRETVKRIVLGAVGHPKADHFRWTMPRVNSRRLRVIAQTEAVADAGRDANHVSGARAGQFDSHEIRVGIHAEAVCQKERLNPRGQRPIRARR